MGVKSNICTCDKHTYIYVNYAHVKKLYLLTFGFAFEDAIIGYIDAAFYDYAIDQR